MGLTKQLGYCLLVSEPVYQKASPYLKDVEWKCLGPQKFKGKTKTMVLYTAYRSQKSRKQEDPYQHKC